MALINVDRVYPTRTQYNLSSRRKIHTMLGCMDYLGQTNHERYGGTCSGVGNNGSRACVRRAARCAGQRAPCRRGGRDHRPAGRFPYPKLRGGDAARRCRHGAGAEHVGWHATRYPPAGTARGAPRIRHATFAGSAGRPDARRRTGAERHIRAIPGCVQPDRADRRVQRPDADRVAAHGSRPTFRLCRAATTEWESRQAHSGAGQRLDPCGPACPGVPSSSFVGLRIKGGTVSFGATVPLGVTPVIIPGGATVNSGVDP